VGVVVWSLLRPFGLASATETFQNAVQGTLSREYSLFVIWQTGLSVSLGVVLAEREKPNRTVHP
jgi:hypothetical protein